MKKLVITCTAVVLAVHAAFAAAAAGNCQAKAAGLKASQTVKLVNEWDSEDKEYTDSGVYYYKVTLAKGSAYSVWLSGGAVDEMSLDVYTDFEADYFTAFEHGETDDGIKYARLSNGDWDEDDPGRVTFYVCVSGDIGAQATLNTSASYMSFVPVGSEDNKLELAFAETQKTLNTTFLDGEYWMRARLTAGRLYRIRTTSGTAEDPILLDIAPASESSEDPDIIEDVRVATDTNNVAIVIEARSTDTYYFQATGGTNSNFTMTYELLKSRAVTAHPSTALTAANGRTATFIPGRRIASWDYADSIIDESLFSVTLAKGERCVVETSGAKDFLLMQLYDAKGTILAENESLDGKGYDVRTVIEATAAGTYYVGVCSSYLEPYQTSNYSQVTITARTVHPQDGNPDEWDALDDTVAGATGIEVLPGTSESSPSSGSKHGPHRLSANDWYDTFVVAARKDITYRIGFDFANSAETTPLLLFAEAFTLSGKNEKLVASDNIMPGRGASIEFTATANAAYYIRVSVAGTKGLEYPGYNVRAVAYTTSGAGLGMLTVNTFGTTQGTWSLGRENVKYPGGSSVLVSGEQTVKFARVNGFSTPAQQTVTVAAGATPTVVNAYYSDTSDPKDDTEKGATSWSLRNTETTLSRTLWPTDGADYFSIAGTDGYYYDIELRNITGDAVFSIYNDGKAIVENVTSVSQFTMPKMRAKYYLVVKHGTAAKVGGSYTLVGKFANVGAIKFSKTAVSVRENAASAVLTVNRTAKDGVSRVKYGTVAGTAKPGVDYIPQQGELVWENGDNKAKTITIKLIPDLVEYYDGSKSFKVQLKPFDKADLAEGEYQASIVGGDSCTVTLTEASRPGTTVASTYAAKAPKLATVKTEDVSLSTGTFYGVLAEDGGALVNGLPALASVTFTASTASPAALSAKVSIAGKTYSFSAKGWDEGADATVKTKVFELVQKVAGNIYTNVLKVTVREGSTTAANAWLEAGGTVELAMNVPDANNKSVQEDIRYVGEIYRSNAKIQGYLTSVTNFTGYYTVALAPSGVLPVDGIPSGNGYITLNIDNKGTVKVAGMLADGTTKPSVSVQAAALRPDEGSSNGYSMYVPIFVARSPYCFGGTLRLYANATGTVVVDSSAGLIWNNDNPAVNYYNEEGFRIHLDPVGGWYNTIINLQTYYLTWLFSVGSPDIMEFPTELLPSGYDFVAGVQPNETAVDLSGNVFSTPKRVLVKNGKLNALDVSINPCNVQVKLARATGLISGSFSLWGENGAGTAQKEISGFKHNGVVLLSRDDTSPLGDIVVGAGFCTVPVNLTDVNATTGRTTKRKWTYSAPFNIIGEDQGATDWYADDWGNP